MESPFFSVSKHLREIRPEIKGIKIVSILLFGEFLIRVPRVRLAPGAPIKIKRLANSRLTLFLCQAKFSANFL
jgi:hypothetical protein